MKRLTFFTLLLVVLNAAAQTETDIRKHYTDVNKKITIIQQPVDSQ